MSEREIGVGALVRFLRSVAVLALDDAAQLSWLRSLDLPGEPALVDELALEFDDGYRLVSQFLENQWLPQGCVAHLAAIDSLLASMSSDADKRVWDVTALELDSRWEEVRRLARQALASL